MRDEIGRSYRLFQESLAVLEQDKEILFFPVLSAIVSLLALAAIAYGGWFFGPFYRLAAGNGELPVLGWVLLFLWYLVSRTVSLYFKVATIACARVRLEGGDPVVAAGFRAANAILGSILAWGVVSATVGLLLQIGGGRRHRHGGTRRRRAPKHTHSAVIGPLVTKLLGAAWSIATFFIVPVLVFEKHGIGASVKRSTGIVKETWGEALAGTTGLGLFAFLLAFPAVALPVLLWMAFSGWVVTAGLVLMLAWWVLLATVFSALGGIYRTALYLYATTKTAPAAFSPELVYGAFEPI